MQHKSNTSLQKETYRFKNVNVQLKIQIILTPE